MKQIAKLSRLAIVFLIFSRIAWAQHVTATVFSIDFPTCTTPAGAKTLAVSSYSIQLARVPTSATLTVTKPSDDCTTGLLSTMATGHHLNTVVLTVYDSDTRQLRTLTLSSVLIVSGKLAVQPGTSFDTMTFEATAFTDMITMNAADIRPQITSQ
jgi:type VI protein secretion system component Hcp